MKVSFDVLATNVGGNEGPVFTRSGSIVVTSMERGALYEVDPHGAGARQLVVLGGNPNGLTEGLGGRLYIAQNGGHGPWHRALTLPGGVQVFHPDGRVSWLSYGPVAPNDLCFGPDGRLYVTDPTRRPARDDGRLWRIDPETGAGELLVSLPWFPNGIGFSSADDAVFVAATGQGRIYRFPLDDGVLGPPQVWVDGMTHEPDGFAFDEHGNVVVACIGPGRDGSPAGQLQVWSAEGTLEEVIRPGDSSHYTNVALNERNRLIVTDLDNGAVLVTDWPTRGLALHPHRPS